LTDLIYFRHAIECCYRKIDRVNCILRHVSKLPDKSGRHALTLTLSLYRQLTDMAENGACPNRYGPYLLLAGIGKMRTADLRTVNG